MALRGLALGFGIVTRPCAALLGLLMPPLLSTAPAGEGAHGLPETVREFRAAASRQPQDAPARTRLALALLAAGLGDAAREEARQAVALDPSSATASQTLGFVLCHDAFGRYLRRGYDRKGAVAAYRAAKELDPESLDVRTGLAFLLEHDGDGVRYGPGASLGEAIEERQAALRLTAGPGDHARELAVALLYAGRDAEVDAATDSLDSAERLGLRRAARVRAQGLAAALAEPQVGDPEERRQALELASSHLARLRLYEEAAALLSEAANGVAHASDLRLRAERLRTTRRHHEGDLPVDDPVATVKRLLLFAWIRRSASADVQQLFVSPRGDARKFQQALTESVEEARRLVGNPRKPRQSWDLDFVLSHSTFVVDGDARLGYQVVAQWGVGRPEELRTTAHFLVPEGGQLRILPTGEGLGFLGTEVLRRAAAGDLAGARQWLDWARGLLPDPAPADPFYLRPMVPFWTKGQQGDLPQIRLAAAALLAGGADPARAAALLQHGRKSARGSPMQKAFYDLALDPALGALGRHKKRLAGARRLRKLAPDSAMAFATYGGVLEELGLQKQARKAAEARLLKYPADPVAHRLLIRLERKRGDLDGELAAFERTFGAGAVDSTVFHGAAAWCGLLLGRVGETELERAQRAAQLRQRDVLSLFTLAALQVDASRPTEARRTMLEALDAPWFDSLAHDSDEEDSDFWYVLGRIAEHHGEKEAAVAAYRKVELPKDRGDFYQSIWRLARRRIYALTQPGR